MINDVSVICPLSLESTKVNGASPRCECCDEALPPLYLREGQNMLPLPIQFFGLSRHGKTTYLAALTMALQRANAIWNGFTALAATKSSQRFIRDVNIYFATGKLPPVTPLGIKDSYLMLLKRIPKWGTTALMVRDCSGEAFREIEIDLQEASFLLKGPITLLFISLEDFKDSGGYTLDTLLTSYLNALAAHGARLEREHRKVIVVLTKADLFWNSLPEDLCNYITADPLWQPLQQEDTPQWRVADMDSYLATLNRISGSIEDWICNQFAGRTLVTLARDHNIEIQFSLVSSTGAAPRTQDNALAIQWQPSRVLDPFLWALELDSRRREEISRYFWGGR
ncbi:MAG: hypothetical protein QOF89_5057 [Acidobacteriota bacterium]|jgi:hypothetical protein|nr:hypothetical protein [Acidobacteriota bacterium]